MPAFLPGSGLKKAAAVASSFCFAKAAPPLSKNQSRRVVSKVVV
jgi:hypothetical protein